jgi:TonB family protein
VGQYKSILGALRVIGETKILSSPRIMVLNNQEAKILVGTKDAYITSTTSQAGSGSTITSQSVNLVDVGIKLYVTPTVNRDGFVTMKIKPEVSSSKRTDLTSQGQITQVPIVTTSETETTIMVKDGTTIIIAGLKKNQRDKQVQKVPLLGDIPLIGFFFRTSKDEVGKTELVIFITPHIVSGDEPLEYASLTNDKELVRMQETAERNYKLNNPDFFQDAETYKRFVFEKIRSTCSVIQAGEKRLKGQIEISFNLNSQGQLINEPKVVSSTNESLNSRAVQCVKSATPFPPFPSSLKKSEEVFKVNLAFK